MKSKIRKCSRLYSSLKARISYIIIIIIIRQPLCPVVVRMPQQAVSKFPCLVLCSAMSCRSSICPGRLSTAWLVSLVVFFVIWSSSGDTRGPLAVFEAVDMPCPGPFHFSHSVHYIYAFYPLSDPDVSHSIFACDVEHRAYFFPFCSVRPQVCSVLVWSVSRSLHHMS